MVVNAGLVELEKEYQTLSTDLQKQVTDANEGTSFGQAPQAGKLFKEIANAEGWAQILAGIVKGGKSILQTLSGMV